MIQIIFVGTQNDKLINYENEFCARIKKLYNQFELIQIKQSEYGRESREILEKIEQLNSKKECKNVFLEIKGKQIDMNYLDSIISQTVNNFQILLIIGGPEGIDPKLYDELNKQKIQFEKISFSNLTFNHHMAKIILIEQIYRILSIKKGIKYHR